MIKCDLTARNFEMDERVKDYAHSKICSLERFLPRQVRETAKVMIVLENDPNGREDNRYVCEAVITVAGGKMVSREGTVNMYAAIDIVEAKLKNQVLRYKEKQTTEPRRGKMLTRLVGRKSETDTATPEGEVI
jgi:ribosomal subunit interface protein